MNSSRKASRKCHHDDHIFQLDSFTTEPSILYLQRPSVVTFKFRFGIILLIMTWHRQIFERAACLFKDNAYFITTSAPFSSVFIPLPHKLHLIKPLLKQLCRKSNFTFSQELPKFRVDPTEKEVLVQAEFITSKSIDGIKFDQQTEYVIRDNQSGLLGLSRQFKEGGEVYGVVLFGGVEGKLVKQMRSNNVMLGQLLLKIFLIICLLKLCKVLQLGTRQQNFHLMKKQGKS